jgi:hypothetical protein
MLIIQMLVPPENGSHQNVYEFELSSKMAHKIEISLQSTYILVTIRQNGNILI